MSRLRDVMKRADPDVVEEVKWKKPSNPAGVPVWSHDGILCIGNTLKSAVRLTFPKGARIRDPKKLFNARLESNTARAIDFREGVAVDEPALKAIVREAVGLNTSEVRERWARVTARSSGTPGPLPRPQVPFADVRVHPGPAVQPLAGGSPYSQEYLSLRARQGVLEAAKIGRSWFSSNHALGSHVGSLRRS